MTTGLLYDPEFLEHDTGPGHPERRERLVSTLQHLHAQPWFDALEPVAAQALDPEWLATTHDAGYARRAEAACRMGHSHLDSMDVSICERSYDIALMAAGGTLALADRVMAGTLDNGFGLLRPPGHHAEQSMALGFCLFNNVAILARYLQQAHGLEKILILDWDVHHGNGTQHTFEEDPSVFYVSLHQYPFYPGTGAHGETGEGRGRGATLNCPMRAGATDADYESAFVERVLPAAEAFAPDAVLISAGFDAHGHDPLAEISLTTDFFGWMTLRMMEVAARHAGGRVISLLEGGYHLQALPRCVARHLEVLMGTGSPDA